MGVQFPWTQFHDFNIPKNGVSFCQHPVTWEWDPTLPSWSSAVQAHLWTNGFSKIERINEISNMLFQQHKAQMDA